ncbi:unnamed protein product [Natator depressus]
MAPLLLLAALPQPLGGSGRFAQPRLRGAAALRRVLAAPWAPRGGPGPECPALYVSEPARPGPKVRALLPDGSGAAGGATRSGPGAPPAHDALLLDPSPGASFGHPPRLFRLDFGVSPRRCRGPDRVYLGSCECLTLALRSRGENRTERRGRGGQGQGRPPGPGAPAERSRWRGSARFTSCPWWWQRRTPGARRGCTASGCRGSARVPGRSPSAPAPRPLPESWTRTRAGAAGSSCPPTSPAAGTRPATTPCSSQGWPGWGAAGRNRSPTPTTPATCFRQEHIEAFFAGDGQAPGNENGSADPRERYPVAELLADLEGCNARRVFLFLDRSHPGPLARKLRASGRLGNVVLVSGQLGSDVARGSAFSEFWARPQPDQCLLQGLGLAGPGAAGSSPGATLQLLNVTLAWAPRRGRRTSAGRSSWAARTCPPGSGARPRTRHSRTTPEAGSPPWFLLPAGQD